MCVIISNSNLILFACFVFRVSSEYKAIYSFSLLLCIKQKFQDLQKDYNGNGLKTIKSRLRLLYKTATVALNKFVLMSDSYG